MLYRQSCLEHNLKLIRFFVYLSADNPNNRRKQNLAMIVVRVAVGHVHCHDREEVVVQSADNLSLQTFIIAGINKRFREFLIFDPKIVYPEFIVFYDRK